MTMKTYKLIVNGYDVGDRLLEGIYFTAYFKLDLITGEYKIIEVVSDPKDHDYLATCNIKYWLKEVYDYVDDIIVENMLYQFDVEELSEASV